MTSNVSIQGQFKYAQSEVTWTREELASGATVDTVTRTTGLGSGSGETLTFSDPKAAEQKFLNWTMILSCTTDEHASALFASPLDSDDLEQTVLWNRVVIGMQAAQAAYRAYVEARHDRGLSSSERDRAEETYGEARRQLLLAIAELERVELP